MHLVLYSPLESDVEPSLFAQIRQVVPDRDIILCRAFGDLYRALLIRSSYELLALVVHPSNDSDLIRLGEVIERIDDVRLILVLRDGNEEMLACGYRLLPRFVSTSSEDIPLIATVLEKMLQSTKRYVVPPGKEELSSSAGSWRLAIRTGELFSSRSSQLSPW